MDGLTAPQQQLFLPIVLLVRLNSKLDGFLMPELQVKLHSQFLAEADGAAVAPA